jgi:hypothetical protein
MALKISIINPRIVTIGNGLSIESGLEYLNNNQIEDKIRRILLENSIVFDFIVVDKKFKSISDFIDADELIKGGK